MHMFRLAPTHRMRRQYSRTHASVRLQHTEDTTACAMDGLQHNTDLTARFYNQSSQLGASWTLLVAISFGLSIMVLASATLHTRHAPRRRQSMRHATHDASTLSVGNCVKSLS